MTRSGTGLRLFVALDPPSGVRETLAVWLRSQRAVHPLVRAVPAEDLHVTLAFLGSRDSSEVSAIARATVAAGATGSALGLRTGGPVWLPPRRPRTLAIELHDDRGDLAHLRSALASALRDAIGWRDDRPFRPHLTVGRRRPGTPMPSHALDPTPALTFDAEALTLYRATLDPDRARYTAVERMGLG